MIDNNGILCEWFYSNRSGYKGVVLLLTQGNSGYIATNRKIGNPISFNGGTRPIDKTLSILTLSDYDGWGNWPSSDILDVRSQCIKYFKLTPLEE